MRKEYAYILCVAGKIKKVIAKSWWNKPKEITIWANNKIDYETPEGKCIITE